MRYRGVRILCFYDIPNQTKTQLKAYNHFRKMLISNGFSMMQFSIYVRPCPNKEYANKFLKLINESAPKGAHIRTLMVTEKQYEDMNIVIGDKTPQEKLYQNNQLILI